MKRSDFTRALSVSAAAAIAGAALVGCSSTETTSGAGQTTTDTASEADASTIVATTSVWADVASAVTGQEVEAIIGDSSIDPHTFEPAAKDLARIREAGTVVANGGAYDASLYTVAEQDKIVHAIPLLDESAAASHEHADHEHAIPQDLDEIEHAWFSTVKVKEVAQAVAGRTGGDAVGVEKRMDAAQQRIDELPHVHIAMTEPIAAPLIWGSELHDITPEGYLKAALNHAEPSAQDIAAFIAELESGHLDLLIVNPQSTNGATEALVKAAEQNNVPIVEMRETPPEGVDFLDYFDQVVAAIADTLAGATPADHGDMMDHGHEH